MVTETRAKKYTDYSSGAVNLTNHYDVKALLSRMQEIQNLKQDLADKIDALIPAEFKTTLANAEKEISDIQTEIRLAVDSLGSYQDLEHGWYAVKQRKVSKSYDASLFETSYPQYAPAVIIKAVDTTKLTGLIKGGLLDERELKAGNIIQEKESFAYVIKC